MHLLRPLLLLAALACACAPPPQIGEGCTWSGGIVDHDDCADGLVCGHSDSCTDDCAGTCRKTCAQDSDCPAPLTCSGKLSEEQGGARICR